MTTHHHFLAAILCDLGSTTPVLVYADWLEEEGDDSCAWWRELAEALGAVRIGWHISGSLFLPASGEVALCVLAKNRQCFVPNDSPTTVILPPVTSVDEGDYFVIIKTTANRHPVIVRGSFNADGERDTVNGTDGFIAVDYQYETTAVICHQKRWVTDSAQRHPPRSASAILPLSRLAAGVRQRLELHPNSAELQAWLPQILGINREELDALQTAPETAVVRFSCQVEQPITLEMDGAFPHLESHPDT